jgi:release factor glutamine methyltransferase
MTSITLAAAHSWAHRALAACSPTPHLDAEVLLGHLTGLSRAQMLAHPELELPAELWDRYRRLVRRRMRDEPVAYLTGRREFMALDFLVTPAVLIPRPETEVLVEQVIRHVRRLQAAGRLDIHVVDVGVGSGAIAVSIAVYCPTVRVSATELSAAALDVARTNVEAHGVEERVRLIHGSLLQEIEPPVDIIAANLPYIRSAELHRLPASVRDYEPLTALNGGPDGLRAYEALFAQIVARGLRPERLCIEIGDDQDEAARQLVARYLPTARCTLLHDLAGRPRVLDIGLP